MIKLTSRNVNILKIIVEEYISTGLLLGSKLLLKKYDLGVSSATVRGDMAILEKLGLIYQPYNSAGRLPTDKGLRAFVNYMMEQKPDHFIAPLELKIQSSNIKNFENSLYTIISNLAKTTGEVSFLIIPKESISKYSGIGNFLDKNHKNLGDGIFNIVKMLEDKLNFINFINSLSVNSGVNIFIGKENIIPYLEKYTIILKPIKIEGKEGFVGIIGSLQMNYSFNISAIRGII